MEDIFNERDFSFLGLSPFIESLGYFISFSNIYYGYYVGNIEEGRISKRSSKFGLED